MRLFQQGSVNLPYSDEPMDIDVEVSYAGFWHSVNDHVNFRTAPEGFGTVEQTWRRREVNSDYFQGSYSTGQVRDNTKRSLSIYVRGQTIAQMVEAQQNLIDWFTQDEYNVRFRTEDLMETLVCECADYRIDMGHVLLHNRMSLVALTYAAHPDTSLEMVL
jgi:hypothetical protein